MLDEMYYGLYEQERYEIVQDHEFDRREKTS